MNRRPFIPFSLCLLLGGIIILGRHNAPATKADRASRQSCSQAARASWNAGDASSSSASKQKFFQTYGELPMGFEANVGQTDRRVRFLSRGSGYTLFLTDAEVVLTLRQPLVTSKDPAEELLPAPSETKEPQAAAPAVLRMRVADAGPKPEIVGLEELPGRSNYFIGDDPEKWHSGVPRYARVKYRNVRPGIDLVFYGKQHQLEYDFIVAPGADSKAITLTFEGAQNVRTDDQGDLVLKLEGGEIRQHKPLVYQEGEGIRQEVAVGYVLNGNYQVGFQVGDYDASRALIIDPGLIYSTYLGGTGADFNFGGLAVDASGSAYVAGTTTSSDFPVTPGAFDTSFNGPGTFDLFVAKLDPSGSALVYSTFLGGSGFDSSATIAVDAGGNAYVTGRTSSSDFPTTPGAFATSLNGSLNAFITKLNPSGSALAYSTFLGGSGFDFGLGITVDAPGNAYVTGSTGSVDFPTTAGAFSRSFAGFQDAFVAKLNPSGSSLVYATLLGGMFVDVGNSIAIDSAGNAYVAGFTASPDFPTTPGAFDTSFNFGVFDIFVAKLDPTGANLVYSTFLGGSGSEFTPALAVDASGSAYVTARTSSSDFPTTPGALSTSYNGGATDAFVAKLNPNGSGLVYSTFLGGNDTDIGFAIAVDGAGNAYITGATRSVTNRSTK